MSKKRITPPWIWGAITFVSIAAAVFGSIWVRPLLYTPSEAPLLKATLGVETSLLPAAVWVAEEKGYFEDYGLDLTIKEFDSGRLSLVAMLESNQGIDIATVAPTPIMFNSFERGDFSIFATFVSSYEDVKVIARNDRVTSAEDLRGKRVGTPMGTTGQFFLDAFLTDNSILSSEVEAVDIDPSDLPDALAKGVVDAIVIWEPHGTNAKNLLGDLAIRLPSSDIYNETFNFVSTNAFLKSDSEAIKRFVQAVDTATEFIKQHKEESQEIVATRLNLDTESMTALWEEFTFDITLEQSLIRVLEAEARWAINSDLVESEHMPNYLDYIYLHALEEVKPEAVTIIR